MKKFYSLLLALVVGLTAVAAKPSVGKFEKAVNKPANVQLRHSQNIINPEKAVTPLAASRSIGGDPILSPEGTESTYKNTSTGFQYSFFGLSYEESQSLTSVVWGEDNTVYIRDIISSLPAGVYVEGEYKDGKITVELPQACYYEESGGDIYTFYASKMQYYEYEDDEDLWMSYEIVADDDNYVVYNVDENGVITLELNDGDPSDTGEIPEYIIGLCLESEAGTDNWYGYGDSYQELTIFDEVPVTIPEGVETQSWALVDEENPHIVNVAFVDNSVYIQGISSLFPEATIKGDIQGDKIILEKDQYLGEFYGYMIYFAPVLWTSDEWEDFDVMDAVELNYDVENKVISTDNELIDLLFIPGDNYYEPLDYVENPTLKYQSEEDTNADPEAPYVAYFQDYDYVDWYDTYEGYIEWIIPNMNVNGYVLDTNRMYYNFLLNGEVMTFTVDEYPYFEEDLTDIPYNYGDDWDLQVLDTSHYFTFRIEDYESFGLQSFYLGTDGKTYASELVTYIPETSKVNTIQSAKEVKSVEFYNIQGQKVNNPENGMYIMRTIYNDGTASVRKIAKK